MPEKPKLIAEFKECPICHCPETVSQRAAKELKEAGKLPKDAFTSLSQMKIPMTDPRVAITVPTLIVYYDACAECGFPYSTKAETVILPVVMQGKPGQPPGAGFSRQ